MKRFLWVFTFSLILIFSCRSKKQNSEVTFQHESSSELKSELPVSYDSISFRLNTGLYFPPQLIRITEGSSHFIALDSSFAGRKYLMQNEREAYYAYGRSKFSKRFLLIHQLAWEIAPVKEMENFDGALMSIATYIPFSENTESEMVRVKIVRCMEDRLAEIPVCTEIRVYPDKGITEICDLNGKCESVNRK